MSLITWTDEERENAQKREVTILALNTSPESIQEQDAELPTDIHLVELRKGDETIYDAVRAYKMTSIFDVYYDKLQGEAQVVAITNGYGRIKPKLYGYTAPETTSKKK